MRTTGTRLLSLLFSLVFVFGLLLTAVKPVHAADDAPPEPWDGSVADSFAGGSGSEDDPYQIANAAQFAYFAQTVGGGNTFKNTYFKLTADIDLNGLDWTPITDFQGYFDGDQNNVIGLSVSGSRQYAGLFGIANSISNLHVYGSVENSSGSDTRTGGIAGSAHELIRCAFTGTVTVTDTGEGYCGGLAGVLYDGSECINFGTVTSYVKETGGIAGRTTHDIVLAINLGTVTGNNNLDWQTGGITGHMSGEWLKYCHNYGSVQGTDYCGGIAGWTTGSSTVALCSNEGSVTGPDHAGGIAGCIADGIIIGCLNLGTVKGDCYAGGIAGSAEGASQICHCYNGTPDKNGHMIDNVFGATVGGIAGHMDTAAIGIFYCFNEGGLRGHTEGAILGDIVNGYDSPGPFDRVKDYYSDTLDPGIGNGVNWDDLQYTLLHDWNSLTYGEHTAGEVLSGNIASDAEAHDHNFTFFTSEENYRWDDDALSGHFPISFSWNSDVRYGTIYMPTLSWATYGHADPVITDEPADPSSQIYGYETAPSLSIAAAWGNKGSYILHYQWFECDDAEGSNPQFIPGANRTTCLLPTGRPAGTYYFCCTVYALERDSRTVTKTTSRIVTMKVDPKLLTVEAVAAGKTYGEADPELAYNSSGLLEGDTITGRLDREAGENVGIYAVTLGTLTAGNNYAVRFTGANFTISPASATVKADAAGKTYGEADPELTAQTTGIVGNDALNYTLSRETGENVGDYAITVSLGENPNYTVTATNSIFTISPASATVKADAAGKTYGEADPELTAKVTGLVGNDTLNYTLSRETGEDAGDYTITIVPGKNPNYTLTTTDGTFTISPAPATITADNKTKVQGEDDPELTATVTGLVGSDTLNYTLSRAGGEEVGEHEIIVTVGENPNYTVTAVNGILTITEAPTVPETEADTPPTGDGSRLMPWIAVMAVSAACIAGAFFFRRKAGEQK